MVAMQATLVLRGQDRLIDSEQSPDMGSRQLTRQFSGPARMTGIGLGARVNGVRQQYVARAQMRRERASDAKAQNALQRPALGPGVAMDTREPGLDLRRGTAADDRQVRPDIGNARLRFHADDDGEARGDWRAAAPLGE
jgi:hypothetical protein